MVNFHNTTPAIGWHFSIRVDIFSIRPTKEFLHCVDTMASSENRQRFKAEDVLAQRQNVNDMGYDRGGMDSGEESEIDRQLLNFDEELR